MISVYTPQAYHGPPKNRPFFEGWYIKLIDPAHKYRLAIIPGIFFATEKSKSHAFIQVLNGSTGDSYYFEYPVDAFGASSRSFEVEIADNFFSEHELSVNLSNDQFDLKGKLNFFKLNKWPITISSPGIMGWYAYVPFMQCYHGIVSLDHQINGSLRINNSEIDFSDGKGYMEKDWGKSFPEAYIWCQSNHFEAAKTSLTTSVAIIPWLTGAFPGFITGFLLEGKLYRFATYTGAKIRHLRVTDNAIEWVVKKKSLMLEMHITKSIGGILQAPTTLNMDRRISETMLGKVQLRLTSKNILIFEGSGFNAGVEAAGKLDKLINLWKGEN